MSLTSGYKKLQNVAKGYASLATNYKSKFDTITSTGIQQAQALKTSANEFMFFIASKMNDIVTAINNLQMPWFNAVNKCQTTLTNMGATPTAYNSSTTYNKGNVVTYSNANFMCMYDNVTGTWDITKWQLLTPNSLGFNWTSAATVTTDASTGVVNIAVNGTNAAYILPPLAYFTNESNIANGTVYLLQD